jgi:antitoxin CptB
MYSRSLDYVCSCYVSGQVYTPRHPIPHEGRYLGRFVARDGSGACGRGGDVPRRTRGALGNRPCPLRGAALSGWTGAGEGRGNLPGWREKLAPVPGSQVPRSKKSPRRSAERRCRVPLFPGVPGNTPRLLPIAPFGASASLSFKESEDPETPTHVKRFAGGDDAWAEKERMNTRGHRADNHDRQRYISPARHVRAFGVWMESNMTGSTRSSGGLDERRKRLLFRCWHRGTREMDLILGRFADATIDRLSETELAQLEELIEVPDPDLYAALSSDALLAAKYHTPLFDRVKTFRADRPA